MADQYPLRSTSLVQTAEKGPLHPSNGLGELETERIHSKEQLAPTLPAAEEVAKNDEDDYTQEHIPWRKLRLAIVLFVPVFLESIDYTIVAVAQPRIASAFGRLDLQTWIGTGTCSAPPNIYTAD